ncbi:MAG: initiation factor 3 [Candidatus Berkelbacteria bacterium Licking1014_85]|uniref:Translation initiation factor IF-3 n=1 Tax=Candidatus Berkelbacteria bacterium Licking1014_85 TaxID=2017148 RepID=A0A554LH68_9BACT|nr:MAG: initiation factor 3 [Candidatus Berkelbacteria bacterium Licking1014_85]
MNQQILLIDELGNNLGIIDADQARYIAYGKGLDLVIVNPNSKPSTAKIIDKGKYQYEIQKKISKSKKNNSQVKEVRLSINMSEHDLKTKIKRAQEFIDNGDKVKLTIILRGRENIYRDRAKTQLEKIIENIEFGKLEDKILTMGNRIMATIVKK